MDRSEFFRTLGRCAASVGLHPCHLLGNWHIIEEYADKRRAEGASPYAVAAELWPDVVTKLPAGEARGLKPETVGDQFRRQFGQPDTTLIALQKKGRVL